MSVADAEPHFVFGVQAGVANSLIYLDEQNIIFPSGNNSVCFNIEQKCQNFIPATWKSQGMLALAISTNRRYLAVSERGEKGTITVYDLLAKNRKRHVLMVEDVPVQEFVSVAFSHDSEYLIGQSGAPHWTLFFWILKKQKVIATVKTGALSNPIYQVSFSPEDNTRICVCGNGVFKLFHHTVGELKPSKIKKLDNVEFYNFLSHAWVSGSQVIVGTDTGQLLAFKSGVLCWETNVITKPSTLYSERKKQEEAVTVQLPRVTVITAYSKGFACSAGPGMVCLFERVQNGDNYRKSKEIWIPSDTCSNDPSQAEKQEIISMCISPTEATLSTSTDQGQLYCISLIAIEMSKEGELAQFEFLTHALHWGTITSLSVCILKPLIATSSLDLSVRIWNFKTNMLELYKGFSEEPHSVAFHPSGLSLLVVFPERMSWMNLLIDDFRTFKEFSMKGCTECAFSNGGHMFAAVRGKTIHIYSTATFENILDLADHSATVRSIVWNEDDGMLVSCGMDGVVYMWNTYSGQLVSECAHKSCKYTNISISPDGSTIFAVGTDCTLKEIQDNQILTEVLANTVTYTTLALSREGTVLFCGTAAGSVMVMRCPLVKPKKLFEFQGHARSITKMVVTFDDQFLLTISEDGSLLIWKIIWNRYGLMTDKKMCYLEEILITKSDLEAKNHKMQELNTKVQVLNIERQFQLRQKDMEHKRKFKGMTVQFTQHINSLEIQIKDLVAEKEHLELDHKALVKVVMEEHAKELKDLNSDLQRKLSQEYVSSRVLQLRSQQEVDEAKQQLHRTDKVHEGMMNELTRCYESKLQENLFKLQQCVNESQQQRDEYELMMKMIEQDADKEIMELRCKYETKVKQEVEMGIQYKDETSIMKKKFSCLQKEINARNVDIERFKSEHLKHQNMISGLEKDILCLTKDIKSRNEHIEEKEIRITEMRKRNIDLEKLKYVLDYQIKELTMQIEPKEKTIKQMKEQIQKMEAELAVFSQQNSLLEKNITEFKLKLNATDKDKRQAMERAFDMTTVVQRFKADLHSCVDFIQDPMKLKDSVLELHRCYIQQSDEDILQQDIIGAMKEGRQREDMGRKVVISLRRQLVKDGEFYTADKLKWLQDDTIMIKELNDLRRELMLCKVKVCDYENQLSVYRKRKSSSSFEFEDASVARPSAPVTTLSPEEESLRIIQLQRLEIKWLRDQILTSTGNRPRSPPPQC